MWHPDSRVCQPFIFGGNPKYGVLIQRQLSDKGLVKFAPQPTQLIPQLDDLVAERFGAEKIDEGGIVEERNRRKEKNGKEESSTATHDLI